MAIAVDLIIALIVAICVFFGYKNGFAKSIIKILSFIIAVIVAIVFYRPLGEYIVQNTEWDDNIRQAVMDVVSKDVKDNGEVKEDTNLSQPIIDYINDTVGTAVEGTKTTIVSTVADKVAITIINIGSALAIFISVRVILLIVSAISSILTDLPVIKQFDKTGGVLYGLIKSLIIIFVIFGVISLISPTIGDSEVIIAINNSFIGSYLYNHNILLNIIL